MTYACCALFFSYARWCAPHCNDVSSAWYEFGQLFIDARFVTPIFRIALCTHTRTACGGDRIISDSSCRDNKTALVSPMFCDSVYLFIASLIRNSNQMGDSWLMSHKKSEFGIRSSSDRRLWSLIHLNILNYFWWSRMNLSTRTSADIHTRRHSSAHETLSVVRSEKTCLCEVAAVIHKYRTICRRCWFWASFWMAFVSLVTKELMKCAIWAFISVFWRLWLFGRRLFMYIRVLWCDLASWYLHVFCQFHNGCCLVSVGWVCWTLMSFVRRLFRTIGPIIHWNYCHRCGRWPPNTLAARSHAHAHAFGCPTKWNKIRLHPSSRQCDEEISVLNCSVFTACDRWQCRVIITSTHISLVGSFSEWWQTLTY